MRIVSLLPSATEIVCGLSLQEFLVGVTHECDFPPEVKQLPKVTRTLIPTDASSAQIDSLVRERLKTDNALYSLNMDVLESVKPDLIVTQALCDVCAVAEREVNAAACALPGNPQVINLEPNSLADVFDCIRAVGKAASCDEQAGHYVASLQSRVASVARRTEQIDHVPTLMVLEWIDPPFSAGHWTPELVEIAGGREVIGIAGQRSVTTSWQSIVDADPEVIVVACCGLSPQRTMQDLPILRAYPEWESLRCVQSRRVFVVDGSAYFSRPGPRLVDSLEILANAIHPQLHPLPGNLSPAQRVEP